MQLCGVSNSAGGIAWWNVSDSDEKCRAGSAESAVGQWTDKLDAVAELERVKARKPGKTVTYEAIHEWEGFDADTREVVSRSVSATVTPNRSVRVHGATVDLTFEIGGRAEYGSYNLNYIGTIVSIGAKTVTFDTGDRRKRLTIAEFSCRNRESVEKKDLRNSEWMD